MKTHDELIDEVATAAAALALALDRACEDLPAELWDEVCEICPWGENVDHGPVQRLRAVAEALRAVKTAVNS